MYWVLACLFVLVAQISCLKDGLAKTPPMGWSSWERFRCNLNCATDPDNCISEKLYMSIADAMVKEGYRDAGYVYVNLDDCWMAKSRDPITNQLVADKTRFPSGMKALADYVHKRGLKLGIYADYGHTTCMSLPGSMYYMQLDAQTFADWGIDFLKFDCCAADDYHWSSGYPPMEKFVNMTGRPMIYSTAWPKEQINRNIKPNYNNLAASCHMSRNTNDLDDDFETFMSIMDLYGKDDGNFSQVAGPDNGYWNDPDEVIVGDFGLTYDEERIQMALYAILASPLILSSDLRNLRQSAKELLLNKNMLAINQDRMGVQGKRIINMSWNGIPGNMQVWTRPILPKGTFAFAYIFLGHNDGMPEKLSFKLSELGMTSAASYRITEVYNGTDMGTFKPTDTFALMINPKAVFFGKATPVESNNV